MKRINLISRTASCLYLVLAVVFVSSCTNESTSYNEQSNNRIKLNEEKIINGYGYSIIEVDGVEYLTQDKGGFIKLDK
jgi:hypothetical protein